MPYCAKLSPHAMVLYIICTRSIQSKILWTLRTLDLVGTFYQISWQRFIKGTTMTISCKGTDLHGYLICMHSENDRAEFEWIAAQSIMHPMLLSLRRVRHGVLSVEGGLLGLTRVSRSASWNQVLLKQRLHGSASSCQAYWWAPCSLNPEMSTR